MDNIQGVAHLAARACRPAEPRANEHMVSGTWGRLPPEFLKE